MAMNQGPVLLGPGGVPLQLPSNWKCPSCQHRPPISDNPQFPPGTPIAMLTAEPGEAQPQFNCLMCWNKFWAKFIRRHAPALVPVTDTSVPSDPESDPDEEVE